MKTSLIAGAALLSIVVVMGLAAPWLAPCHPSFQSLEQRLEPPSLPHPLGMDELGRDILSRLLYGARVSMLVGFFVVLLSAALGTVVGAVAGYAGGRVDALLMRLTEVFLAFPGILLAIALVAVLGPALDHLILALVVIGWVGYARLVRAQVLALRQRSFIAASQAAGAGAGRIMVRHVLPHVLPTLSVQASLGMAGAILAEASLSFLGLGIKPPHPSWGSMINAGRSHLLDAPHVALFPGLAILITVLGLNFLGDGLSDLLDPHRGRRAVRANDLSTGAEKHAPEGVSRR